MLRRRDVDEIKELKREGLSIRAISRLTGFDRKTIGRFFVGTVRQAGLRTQTGTAEQAGTLQAISQG